jgi:GT2 family glycosyltransferase
MRLTAIVPATNEPATLESALAAIRGAADAPDEVIVVETLDAAGPAAARNAGALRATGDVLVFVDADVVVNPEAFTSIRAAFAADRGLAAVFGSYDDRPSARGIVSVFRNLLHHHVHQKAAGPAETFWAGLGAVRRDAFDAVHGFDAERFAAASVEDIDFGMRVRANGGRILLDPSIQGKHLKAWSIATMVHTDLVKRGVPWIGLLLRHRSALSALNLGWRYRLSAVSCVGGMGALLAQRAVLALLLPFLLLALNRQFYWLLLRRGGAVVAAAGIVLLTLHHLTAVAAVPLAVGEHLRQARRGARLRTAAPVGPQVAPD